MVKDLTSKAPLAFVGLGAIGLPIAANLLKAGFDLKVHTRSRTAETNEKLAGAKPCSSARDAAKDTNILLICVSDENAVDDVLFGSQGAESNLNKGNIVIDLSTITPEKAKYFSEKLAKKGVTYVDAPVSGGTEGAKAGTLTIFLGANNKTLKEIECILKSIANSIYPFGKTGKGQEVKALNQVLVAGTYAAVAEAIALGQELLLPMDLVVEALQKGAASSWALTNRSESMLKDDYPLGFKLELHHKDLCIALKTAESVGLQLPVTFKVKELEEELLQEGYHSMDVSILRRSIKRRQKTDDR